MNRNLQLTIAWFALAFLVTLAAVWQAQVTVAREVIARNQPPPPPVKTRRVVRPVPVQSNENPVADYIARCEKGLTDQEIGWILEDFRNSGVNGELLFDEKPHKKEDYLSCRAAHHRWYRDTLVDGLRLSPEQSEQIARKLAEYFAEAKDEFLKTTASEPESVEPYANMAIVDFWLLDPTYKYHPWNLCDLTQEQEKITWKHFFEIVKSRENLGFQDRPTFPDNKEQALTTGGPLFLRPGPVEPEKPDATENLPKYWYANLIFPFLTQQDFGFRDPSAFDHPIVPHETLLESIRRLHPAQLKTLLLLCPYLVELIQRDLEIAKQ
jgi:hypothetical protein